MQKVPFSFEVAFQSLQSCNLHLLEFFRYGPCFDHKLERGLVIESRINRMRYIISHFTVTSFFSNFATIFEWDELTWYAQVNKTRRDDEC